MFPYLNNCDFLVRKKTDDLPWPNCEIREWLTMVFNRSNDLIWYEGFSYVIWNQLKFWNFRPVLVRKTYTNIWWYKFGGKVWILCPKVNVYSQWTGQIPTNKPCGLRSSHPHPLLWDGKVDVYPPTHSKPPKKAQHLCNIQWLCVCVYKY